MKTLIAYFSRADENYFAGDYRFVDKGNTEVIVECIQKLITADVFKIEMVTPYAADYETCIAQAKKDLSENARPEIKTGPDSIEDYDKVILAYPNYWGTIPMPLFTFLEKYDWQGKSIYPVCTNEGSGLGRSARTIHSICSGADVKPGLSIHGSSVGEKETLEKLIGWLVSSGLIG